MEISLILFINFKFSQDCTSQQIGFIPNILPVRSPRGPCAGSMPTISTLFIGCQSLAWGPSNRNRNMCLAYWKQTQLLRLNVNKLSSKPRTNMTILSHTAFVYLELTGHRTCGLRNEWSDDCVHWASRRCKLGVVRVLDFENKYWLLCSIDWFLAWLHCHCFDLLPSQQSRLPATVLCPQIYP